VEPSVAEIPGSSAPPPPPLFQAGTPASYERLTVIPLYGLSSQSADYLSLDAAAAAGFTITEVDEDGKVSALQVTNPLDRLVLLYEGEEVVGAKQNRMIARPILVPERTSPLTVPASCVERGRWNWRDRHLTPSAHASHPSLRAAAHRLGQQGVWDQVAAAMERHQVESPTHASEDVYASQSERIDRYLDALPLADGQCGSLVLVDGAAVCADWVSRPEVHSDLYPKLLRGYALEALNLDETAGRGGADEEAFMTALSLANRRPLPPVGAGSAAALEWAFVSGHELRLDDDLVALTALAV